MTLLALLGAKAGLLSAVTATTRGAERTGLVESNGKYYASEACKKLDEKQLGENDREVLKI